MKTVKIELPRSLEYVQIHTFADWHIGDLNCISEEINRAIDEVINNDKAYVICNGDLINNATKGSKSDIYSEVLNPMQAIDRLVNLLEPVKDKILMITNGNHESRTFRESGIDLSAIVAGKLGLLDRYCCEGGLLFLKVGAESRGRLRNGEVRQIPYTIYATHGSGGGGRREGSKITNLSGLSEIIDADIYVHSHTHLPAVFKNSFFRVDQSNCAVKKVDRLYVNTSAKLDYGGYGQVGEFKPAATKSPIIILDGREKKFQAIL